VTSPLVTLVGPADSGGMDPAELASFMKAAAELLVALEAFSKLAERLYPLALRGSALKPVLKDRLTVTAPAE